jgi:hypothetical protein
VAAAGDPEPERVRATGVGLGLQLTFLLDAPSGAAAHPADVARRAQHPRHHLLRDHLDRLRHRCGSALRPDPPMTGPLARRATSPLRAPAVLVVSLPAGEAASRSRSLRCIGCRGLEVRDRDRAVSNPVMRRWVFRRPCRLDDRVCVRRRARRSLPSTVARSRSRSRRRRGSRGGLARGGRRRSGR